MPAQRARLRAGANQTATRVAAGVSHAGLRCFPRQNGLRRTMCRRLLIAGMLLALPCGANAHAFLDTGSPSVGSTVQASPAQVQLTFTQALEAAFSTLRVEDAQGRQVDKKDVSVAPDNPLVLRVSLPRLPAGTYQVSWRVLSVDGHVTEGTFKFSVAQ